MCLILLAPFLCNCHLAFISIRLFSVHVVHPYGSIDTTAAWKKLRFILSERSDIYVTDYLSIAVPAFARCCWCLSRFMRHCFLGRWTCLLVSENNRLVLRCRLSDQSTFILSVVRWNGYLTGFWLGWLYLTEAQCHWRSPRP